jgi:hypothetical protein
MNTIYFDSPVCDEERRKRLYDGHLFVFSPLSSSIALCEFAREMIQEAFGGLDPTAAQFDLTTEQYVAVLAKLKPQFVHHAQSMNLVQNMLEEVGCDLGKTYIDVPRLKSIPHGEYHPSGLTFAIHAHRDTWYSAPFCQLNWWLPVYDLDTASALAFHPRYWSHAVLNGSSRFNHYRWNKYGRKTAATDMQQYIQDQPQPEEPIELEPQIRPITRAGGILLFSGAQLHSAVPNTSGKTRFSIDFRTVNLDDVLAKVGAPNIDSAATGTTLRDFRRGTDLSGIPEEIVSLYDSEPVTDGEFIFQPPTSAEKA